MDYPAFVGADFQSQSRIAGQERLVNMMLERLDSPGAGAKAGLFVVPGVTTKATGMGSPGRAHFSENNREFAVQGTTFVEIDVSYNITNRGTAAIDSNQATISSNGKAGSQLLVCSGTNAYSFDLNTNTLTQIAALNGKASMGDYIDGYGLVLDRTTGTWYYSALNDFTSWTTGTNFENRSKASDPWQAIKVNGIYIGLFGQFTSEFWYDAGGSTNPFAPDPSGLIPYGIAAPFSLAVGEGSIFWLGQSRVGQRYVLRATGFTPEVVSDLPIQLALNSYATVSDAIGEIINYNGHTLYLLSFPSADITWAYDLSTGLWFQWGTWIAEANAYSAWRPRFHVIAFGEHRLLDSQTGAVYKLDASVHTDVDGRPIRWLRRAPGLMEGNDLIFYQSLELYIEPGVGTSGQGDNPQIMLRTSRDGGATWGPERWKPLGKTGQYANRVIWEQMGAARRLVVEVSGSDPVPAGIIGAGLELSQPIAASSSGARAS